MKVEPQKEPAKPKPSEEPQKKETTTEKQTPQKPAAEAQLKKETGGG